MLRFRLDWVYSCAKQRPGGISAIVEQWPGPTPIQNRSTFYRWFRKDKEVPSERILQLACVLNLDPIAFYEINPALYESLCFRLIRGAFYAKSNLIMNDLSWIGEILAPARNWPPKSLPNGDSYGTSKWTYRDLRFAPHEKCDYFQKLQISVRQCNSLKPQVWHFAFREAGNEKSLWRPYGFVVREGGCVALYGLGGTTSFADIQAGLGSFIVETWIGTGSVDFRVASLHNFNLGLIAESALESALPTVRFS